MASFPGVLSCILLYGERRISGVGIIISEHNCSLWHWVCCIYLL